jgi:hypothetical protein
MNPIIKYPVNEANKCTRLIIMLVFTIISSNYFYDIKKFTNLLNYLITYISILPLIQYFNC